MAATNPDNSTPRNRALTTTDIARRIGIGRTSFIRLVTLNRLPAGFPKPLITTPGGPQRSGTRLWLEADIDAWLNGEGRA